MTLTAVNLPTNTTYATGYTTSALTTTQTGCLAATPSGVTWNFSTGTSGTSHTLTTPLVIGASGNANNPLTVTLTRERCEHGHDCSTGAERVFSMPSFTGITATAGGTTITTTPNTNAWTSRSRSHRWRLLALAGLATLLPMSNAHVGGVAVDPGRKLRQGPIAGRPDRTDGRHRHVHQPAVEHGHGELDRRGACERLAGLSVDDRTDGHVHHRPMCRSPSGSARWQRLVTPS